MISTSTLLAADADFTASKEYSAMFVIVIAITTTITKYIDFKIPIEVLCMGYISDIFRIFPSGQQPCSRAAMYSGDWGKSLFTSLISYAGS